MSLLIINTLPEDDIEAIKAINYLSDKSNNVKVFHTAELNIMHCTGCKSCMYQTAGNCCLKDDYKNIVNLILKYTKVIFTTDTSLNFLSYRTMRLFERRFSFAVKFCEFRNNTIKHIRYDKLFSFGILYKGSLDKKLLNDWLTMYTNHTDDTSLGVYPINCVEELCKCISL